MTRFAKLSADRSGAIGVLAAVFLVAGIGFVALCIDLGLIHAKTTQLQAASDAAALAAVIDTGAAASIAGQSVADNGFAQAAVKSVTVGSYCPDQAVTPSNRFQPGNNLVAGCSVAAGPLPNAVQTVLQATSVPAFGRMVGAPPFWDTDVSSVAVRIDAAGLRVGSSVVSLNGGLVNGMLSSLLGAQISLGVASYNGLLHTNVAVSDLLTGLAGQLGLTVGSYSAIAGSSISVQRLLQATSTAVAQQPASSAQAATLAGLQSLQNQVGAAPSINLAKLMDLGPWSNNVPNVPSPAALQASLNVFDLVRAAAQLATGQSALAVQTVTGLPGLASLAITASAIQPPQSAYFTFGPVGAVLHTAQTRLQLDLQLLNALPVAGQQGVVNLPIYLELGSGTATLTGIACATQQASVTQVKVNAQSALLRGWVGRANAAAMKNFSQSASSAGIAPAVLLNLANLVTVTGTSSVTAGSGNPVSLVFTQDQIAAGMTQTVTSNQITATTLQSLLSNLSVSANVLGAGVLIPGLGNSVAAQVSGALGGLALDPLINTVLNVLGVRLGSMDVGVTGVRCRVPVVVR